jgi:hypothetical protein
LLQLRRENLLESKTLCLLHCLSGHTPSLPAWVAMSKQFREHGFESKESRRKRRTACNLKLSVHHDRINLSVELHDFSE